MTIREHWEKVYKTNLPDKVGWYKPHLETSLKWIKALSLDKDANIIDVGGGTSTLVDDLLADGYRSITVLDLSQTALALTKRRLRERAASVIWLEGDITSVDLPTCHYDLWHDRAVFHFLTDPEQRQRYVENLLKALKPAGHLIIATFSLEAPPKCSGLRVQRYSADKLERILGSEFLLKKKEKELHITPGGVKQMYLYCHFQRTA
ncbi:MAG: class I SAM-dependent methyltransferase [Ardenticatenia bacterium]|nr:class I SAM-dependent methyltransferase [Ardenticatenia bacterium]